MVLLGPGDGEGDRDLREERVLAEVGRRVEAQAVAAGRDRGALGHELARRGRPRRSCPRRPACSGCRCPGRPARGATATPAAGRPRAVSRTWVEIIRRPAPRRRRPTILSTSASAVRASSPGSRSSRARAPGQQRGDRVLAHAGDEREAEALAVGGVDLPQVGELGRRSGGPGGRRAAPARRPRSARPPAPRGPRARGAPAAPAGAARRRRRGSRPSNASVKPSAEPNGARSCTASATQGECSTTAPNASRNAGRSIPSTSAMASTRAQHEAAGTP